MLRLNKYFLAINRDDGIFIDDMLSTVIFHRSYQLIHNLLYKVFLANGQREQHDI